MKTGKYNTNWEATMSILFQMITREEPQVNRYTIPFKYRFLLYYFCQMYSNISMAASANITERKYIIKNL
jgi:hypothetical protein